ncbi:DUF3558 family protein [Nocardia sp. NPDC005825]|uniref:DUF3558 family protein n=1 Tax=unclassified Nocardia TaxID=2637762 RepID=UPI0033C1B49A
MNRVSRAAVNGTERRARRSLLAAAAGGAMLVLVGCGTTITSSGPTPISSSAPQAAVTTPPAAQTGGPAPGAPVTTAAEVPAATPDHLEPGPAATPEPAAPWNPCNLSDSALSAVGLDTATKTAIGRSCRWQSVDRTFELSITADDSSLETLLGSGKYVDIRRTNYYGREWVQFRAAQDTHKLGCYVGTPAPSGSITFTAKNIRVQTDFGDPCQDVNKVAGPLWKLLP